VLFYGINVGNPKYADVDFRQAIVQAVDREALAALVPSGILANGLIPMGVPGHREDACAERCAHNPEAAAELLATAFPSGVVPTVNLDYFESAGTDIAVAEAIEVSAQAIKADLETVGIPVELRPKPFDEYSAFVTSSDQELFLFGWPGIAPIADSYISPLFLTNSLDNVTAFGSEAVDAGIAAARAWPDVDDRIEAYQAVEDSILAAMPIMPFVQFETVQVVGDSVAGFVPQLDGTFVVAQVSISR
jgi:ABC-type transport system substrate-binding protein